MGCSLRPEYLYYHCGSIGDINNDGNIDILGYSSPGQNYNSRPILYLNDGIGNFSLSNGYFNNTLDRFWNLDQNWIATCELFDIDNDKELEMFLAAYGTFKIYHQQDQVYLNSSFSRVPIPLNYCPLHIIFFDFTFDGEIDLLTIGEINHYNGYALHLSKNTDEGFIDVTDQYFDISEGDGIGTWIYWIRMFDFDKDGDLDIVGDGTLGDLVNKVVWWRNDFGKFKRVIQ